MSKSGTKLPKKFSKKLLTFQKQGLEAYNKYLKKEMDRASKKKKTKKYRKYLESEIERASKKLKKLKAKLA